ncbi:MAG: DUF3501 family protein [Vicinamibacteria bacterium]
MRKVTFDEIRDIAQYERVREDERSRLIGRKRPRRIALGDHLTLLFENHDTVLFQIQEMMRAERIVLPERIQDEIDTYNALVPDPGQLSATLFIELTDIARMATADVRTAVNRFRGIQDGHVSLIAGVRVLPARFESGETSEEKLAGVHYLRFDVPDDARAALADPAQPVRLVCTHPHHPAETALAPETRAELLADLAG